MADKDAYRDAKARHAAESRVLFLIRAYYPEPLKTRVIRCVLGQLGGLKNRGCKSRYCPLCSPRQSKKRTLSQYARFQRCTPHNRPVRLGHHVYTLPPALRHRLADPDGLDLWKLAVRRTIREIEGADVAGIMNLHMLGDQDITRMHPHWDVILNGYVLRDGEFIRHTPPAIDAEKARATYKANLARAFELGPAEEPPEVDLWLGGKDEGRDRRVVYRHGHRATMRMLAYSARNVYQPENAWYSDATPAQGDWYYQPRPRNQLAIYQGLAVLRNFHDIDQLMHGKKWRCWIGYMQSRAIGNATRLFHAEDTSEEETA